MSNISDIAGQIKQQGAESCGACSVILMCTRWDPKGTWDYRKGVMPCIPRNEIVDAEEMQRISLRRLK